MSGSYELEGDQIAVLTVSRRRANLSRLARARRLARAIAAAHCLPPPRFTKAAQAKFTGAGLGEIKIRILGDGACVSPGHGHTVNGKTDAATFPAIARAEWSRLPKIAR